VQVCNKQIKKFEMTGSMINIQDNSRGYGNWSTFLGKKFLYYLDILHASKLHILIEKPLTKGHCIYLKPFNYTLV
jgi:hypothetical protein